MRYVKTNLGNERAEIKSKIKILTILSKPNFTGFNTIAEKTGFSPVTIVKHLQLFKDEELVNHNSKGENKGYRVTQKGIDVRNMLKNNERIWREISKDAITQTPILLLQNNQERWWASGNTIMTSKTETPIPSEKVGKAMEIALNTFWNTLKAQGITPRNISGGQISIAFRNPDDMK